MLLAIASLSSRRVQTSASASVQERRCPATATKMRVSEQCCFKLGRRILEHEVERIVVDGSVIAGGVAGNIRHVRVHHLHSKWRTRCVAPSSQFSCAVALNNTLQCLLTWPQLMLTKFPLMPHSKQEWVGPSPECGSKSSCQAACQGFYSRTKWRCKGWERNKYLWILEIRHDAIAATSE